MNFFSDFLERQNHVIDSLKMILFNRHPEIFDRISFSDDKIYLEPLLYAYVSQTEDSWLDSLIYGFELKKKPKIQVASNSSGVIYLPNVGYFITSQNSKTFDLHTIGDSYSIFVDGINIDFTFEPLLFLSNGIEIVKYQHPLLEKIYLAENIENAELSVDGIHIRHLETIENGFSIILAAFPELFEILVKTLKKIQLFSSTFQTSFATMLAHNMIFLNVRHGENEIFFADHITHEGSHVFFFTLTYESKYRIFNCHPNTPYADISLREWDHATIYLRFHGLFTYTNILELFFRSFENKSLSKYQLFEIEGRFVFYMQKFMLELKSFENLNVLSEEGKSWFDLFAKAFQKFENRYLSLSNQILLSMQPYDFSSEIYFKQNSY